MSDDTRTRLYNAIVDTLPENRMEQVALVLVCISFLTILAFVLVNAYIILL